MKISQFVVASILAIGSVGVTVETADAQSIDPAVVRQAPPLVAAQTTGTVARYFAGPMGHVRGFVLDNGMVVFVHGPAGDAMPQQVAVGQQVRVDGLAHATTPTVIRRATVYGANGNVVVAAPPEQPGGNMWQQGPEHPGMPHGGGPGAMFARLPQRATSAVVQTLIAGPHGHTEIALLSDGTAVYFDWRMAREVNQHGLRVGEAIQVIGRGEASQSGAGILAEQITFADGVSVAAPIAVAPDAPAIAPAVR